MDLLVSTQFEQMCRACMSCNKDVLQSLFDYVDDYQNKRIQIYELLNIAVPQLPKIEIMDALPKSLCTLCVEKLCAFYEFQNCCINSDLHLRKLIVSSMIQATEINSADPLQSDFSEIEELIKQEIVEKNVGNFQKLIKGEDSNDHDDLKRDDRTYTDTEEEKEDDYTENQTTETKGRADADILGCTICEKKFLYKRNLMRHLKRTHNIKSTKESKKAKRIKKEDADLDDSHEEQQCSCDICEKSFCNRKSLKKHMKRSHDIEPLETTDETSSKVQEQIIREKIGAEENEAKWEETANIAINSSNEENLASCATNKTTLLSTENGAKTDVNNEENIQADKSELERVYLCEICETEFSYKKNLKRHMKRAHDFEWPTDVLIESDAQETNVKKVKKDNRTWACEICKTHFLYKRNLRRHMIRTHNEESPIEIKTGIDIIPAIVKIEQKSDSESSAEEWDIPKISIWTCDQCQKKFTFKKNLKRHMHNIHNKELTNEEAKAEDDAENTSNTAKNALFKCNECDSAFHKKVYLRKHKYRHKQPGGLKREKKNCDICGLLCKTLQVLREHYISEHPDRLETSGSQLHESLKLYICQYCNKSFQQSCTLKDHLRIHTKEQPFLCSHCGRAFNSISNLRQHVLRHETEKRYECPDCPKKFPCLSDLASHKRSHTQLKPHICDICGAAFGKPYQLKTHKMYHNGEKRYQCEYCAMRFVCGDHLRRHIRTHTGEKPYSCKYCPRSFSQSNDMIKHLRTHLGENVYQCELCPAAFRLAAELRTHFSLHKNDDEETKKRNKLAWHEAQEQLKLKLESERPTHSKSKEGSVAKSNLLPQGGRLLLG